MKMLLKILLWIFFWPIMILYYVFKSKTSKRSNYNINNQPNYYADIEAPQILRILNDCQQIVNTSKSIDTVISRVDLGEENARKLSNLELCGAYTSYPNSEYYFKIFVGKRSEIINKCIERAFGNLVLGTEQLKTAKAKVNRYTKFLSEIHKFDSTYSLENKRYVETIEKDISQRIIMLESQKIAMPNK